MMPPATITCCGYVAHLGTPKPWECPACGKVHVPEVPVAPAGEVEAVGAAAEVPDAHGDA